jgi:hypothetical protein
VLHAPPMLLFNLMAKIFGEQYKLRRFSLLSSLHSTVTSSLLGSNILSTRFSNTSRKSAKTKPSGPCTGWHQCCFHLSSYHGRHVGDGFTESSSVIASVFTDRLEHNVVATTVRNTAFTTLASSSYTECRKWIKM